MDDHIVLLKSSIPWMIQMLKDALDREDVPYYLQEEINSGLSFSPDAGLCDSEVCLYVPVSLYAKAKYILDGLPVQNYDLTPDADPIPRSWFFYVLPKKIDRIYIYVSLITTALSLIFMVCWMISYGF